jgi:thiol-disulfide isomerase/thioredoxin
MKSLPLPKKQDGGPVNKIVADNYDDVMHRAKKDSVMYFYAPWCAYCKEFDSVYKKVAKKMLKTNKNVVFGKMDAAANDIPYMFPELKVGIFFSSVRIADLLLFFCPDFLPGATGSHLV